MSGFHPGPHAFAACVIMAASSGAVHALTDVAFPDCLAAGFAGPLRLPVRFCNPVRLSLGTMAEAELIHAPAHGSIAGSAHLIRLFQKRRLVRPDSSMRIVTLVRTDDFLHGASRGGLC